jgi:5-hydroxyisourate hydrolase-like protein (transthyretin family)
MKNTMHYGMALAMLLGLGAASGQTVSGTVTNRTNDKPAAGDDVVLLKLAQGMQELERTTTDSKGHYTIKLPAGEAQQMHLIKVTHDKANYFSPEPPGTAKVDVDVYTASPDVADVVVSEDVLQLQTTPDGKSLSIVEHYLLRNDSKPQTTLFSEHPFEIYLPAGAKPEGASAKAPSGMAVQQPLVPMGDPDHYTIIFPVRPGETEFNVWYRLPYTSSFNFQPRLTLPTEALGIMMPRSMTFKGGTGTEFRSVTEQVGGKAQAFLAQNVKPSQPLSFSVSGSGELPRDTVAQNGAGDQAPGSATAGNGDPNTDQRPGGGLGTPLDKDAERDPWTKYRWWIIGGLGLVLAAAAGLMLRTPPGATGPSAPESAGVPAAASPRWTPPAPAGGALQVLRDEMFAVETERLEGRLSEREYAELKSAYDVVLRRALVRNGRTVAAEETV